MIASRSRSAVRKKKISIYYEPTCKLSPLGVLLAIAMVYADRDLAAVSDRRVFLVLTPDASETLLEGQRRVCFLPAVKLCLPRKLREPLVLLLHLCCGEPCQPCQVAGAGPPSLPSRNPLRALSRLYLGQTALRQDSAVAEFV